MPRGSHPWAGLPGDVHAPADALEDMHASEHALEDAHAAADLEEEAMIPDAAAHPCGRPKRARRQTRFFGDDSSSDSSSSSSRSPDSDSTPVLYRLKVDSVVWR